MKKILLLSIILCFSVIACFSQDAKQDVVELKDGTVMKGTIIEQVPNDYVKLKVYGGSIFVYKVEEIEKITKETTTSSIQVVNKRRSKPTIIKHKGTLFSIESGFTVGQMSLEDFATVGTTTKFIGGYQFNNYLYTGIGIGIDYYGWQEVGNVPISLELGGNLTKNKVTPTYFFGAGYNIPIHSQFAFIDRNVPSNQFNSFVGPPQISSIEGGLLLNAGIGLRAYTKKKASFILNLGYKLSQATFTHDGNVIFIDNTFFRFIGEEKGTYHNFTMRIGVAF